MTHEIHWCMRCRTRHLKNTPHDEDLPPSQSPSTRPWHSIPATTASSVPAPRETPTDAELKVQQGALEDAARALAHALDRAETTPEDRGTLELALGVLRRNSGEVARALKFRAECAAEDAR